MPKIFISYRRADSQAVTERIHDRLVKAFGANNVFLDVDDNIPPGSNWAQVLEDSLIASDVLLVIIGREWERIINERATSTEDYVRFEIEHGLNRPDMLVIPVLVNNAIMPYDLPPSVSALKQRQVMVVRGNPDFHNDMDKLITVLKPKSGRWLLLVSLLALFLVGIWGINSIFPNFLTRTPDSNPTPLEISGIIPNPTSTRADIITMTLLPTHTPTIPTIIFNVEQLLIARTVGSNLNEDIFIIAADGSNERNLTDNPETDDDAPDWSADGQQLVFVSDRDGNKEIYIMGVFGAALQRLTVNTIEDNVPAWSPDGSQIAFASMLDGDWDIYVIAVDGGNLRQLTANSALDYAPVWSPDGSQIAFYSDRDSNREIYLMNSDGRNPIRLTNNTGVDAFPEWSPDGSQIAFHSNRDGNFEIYAMNSNGSQVRRLTLNDADDWDVAWSSDGTRISFVSNRANREIYEVYVMNADGSNVHPITEGLADNFVPDWIPIP